MTETTSYPHAVTLSAEMMSTLRHGEQAMQVAQDAAQRGFAATLAAVLSMHGVPVGADFVVEPQDDGTAIVLDDLHRAARFAFLMKSAPQL
ncbi:MAG: hypothetical protein ACO277_08210, partial [Ilumatobacteraceae bacterium]